jgi:hypothetical protein
VSHFPVLCVRISYILLEVSCIDLHELVHTSTLWQKKVDPPDANASVSYVRCRGRRFPENVRPDISVSLGEMFSVTL